MPSTYSDSTTLQKADPIAKCKLENAARTQNAAIIKGARHEQIFDDDDDDFDLENDGLYNRVSSIAPKVAKIHSSTSTPPLHTFKKSKSEFFKASALKLGAKTSSPPTTTKSSWPSPQNVKSSNLADFGSDKNVREEFNVKEESLGTGCTCYPSTPSFAFREQLAELPTP